MNVRSNDFTKYPFSCFALLKSHHSPILINRVSGVTQHRKLLPHYSLALQTKDVNEKASLGFKEQKFTTK
jgi:hypothetical protein